MVELLAPAGDLERLKVAIMYGADAVYFGSKQFSLRARASNFSKEDIKEACLFAHKYHKKVYITVNMIPHNSDFEGLKEYLLYLDEVKVDGIIVASRAIAKMANDLHVSYPIHISTQQTTVNHIAVNDFKTVNASRVVLAREVTFDQLVEIKKHTDLELEVFIHGGMCANYSGRCTISNLLTNRDANRGGCAHSCRWYYHLYHNDECLDNGIDKFTLGSKDMCAIDYILDLLKLDLACFKIEGRMKTAYYIANIVKAYRYLIDCYYQNKTINNQQLDYAKAIIEKAANRENFAGFYPGQPKRDGQLYQNDVLANQSFIGNVLDYKDGYVTIQVRNHFEKNDKLQVLKPIGDDIDFVAEEILDMDNNIVEVANKPLQLLKIKLDVPVDEYCFIRKAQR